VGTGQHRVDIAVTVPGHPDRWLVAVDGDGPGYATWRGTRERDRLWPQELERRGWRHLRVWSTDLYRDPARDVARIVTVVREEARALAGTGPTALTAGTAGAETEGADTDESGSESPATGASAVAGSEPEPGATTGDATAEAGLEPEPGATTGDAIAEAGLEPEPGATTGDATEGHEAAGDESRDASAASKQGSKRQRRRAFRRGTKEATAPTDVAAQTADDTDAGWGERRDDATHEQWLRDQRPPHWD
jgi:hypothetical protein